LYCGKEIGAFRVLRDSEFCCIAHRRKYGERLSKTLHDISAPEPPPAPLATFRDQMPLQTGNLAPALHLFQRLHLKGNRTPRLFALTLDVSDPSPASEPTATAPPAPAYPPIVENWMAAPGADPVEAFRAYSTAAGPVMASRAPRFAAGLAPTPVIQQVRHFPALCQSMQPVPNAEPVAAFVQASSHAVAIDTRRAPRFGTNLAFTARIDHAAHAPAMATTWEAPPAPEPVAARLQASSHAVATHTVPAPRFAANLALVARIDRAAHVPAMATTWEASPAPEPAAAFVQATSSTELMAASHTVRLPHFTAEFDPIQEWDEIVTPDPCDRWMPSPAAQPVAAFVQASAALALEAIALRLPALSPVMYEGLPLSAIADPIASLEPSAAGTPAIAALTPAYAPAGIQLSTLAPAALPSSRPPASERWINRGADSELTSGTPVLSGSLPARIGAPILPSPQFDAELEPMPSLDDLLDPPAICEAFQPGPAPQPVFSYLQCSMAGAIEISFPVTLPAQLDFLAVPHVPRIRQSLAAPFAEGVMAKVRPVAATAPLVLLRKTTVALPDVPGQAAAAPVETPFVATGARPEASESLLGAAHCSTPISIQRTPRATALTAPGLFAPAPISGDFVPSPEAGPLESLLLTALAAELPMARNIKVLPLVMAAALERSLPSLQALQMAPEISQPGIGKPSQQAPRPVATLFVAQPGPSTAALDSHLPRREMAPMEFHSARLRGEPVGRPEWIPTRLALLPPLFSLRAALDKLEEPVAQPKPAKKAPELLNMPTAKRKPTLFMVVGRIAAAFLLASSIWYGVTNYRTDRRLSSEDLASSGPALASAPTDSTSAATPGVPAPAAPKGVLSLVKQAIADRASVKVAENFASIDAWQGAEKTRPAGWKRHADGYMNTGSLALFSPTLKFKDYRMEFFGQIENKSIGWTVRSKDADNYHAMKLSVIEAGTRPFVALVQYNVVAGKAGRRTQTPLNIMVHNNRPMQFAIDVKGSRFVTSIDGEEVDAYVDSSLSAGGVGFFSDTGERARLYWLRVARNDDWLGHVCAMLADGVSTTATLRTPAGPAGPLPGLPSGEDSLLLGAAWLGLPYLRAPRKIQFTQSWRSKPWNS
jgi:hypothetical protein